MFKSARLACLAVAAMAATASTASAVTVVANTGSYAMTSFGGNSSFNGAPVSSIAISGGDSLTFSTPLLQLPSTVYPVFNPGLGGYTAPIFLKLGAGSVTLTLPSNTAAFSFYSASQDDSTSITAIASDGSAMGVTALSADPSLANFFGFSATSGYLTTIQISGDDIQFAIGNFAINIGVAGAIGDATAVPLPTAASAGMTLLGASLIRRRRA